MRNLALRIVFPLSLATVLFGGGYAIGLGVDPALVPPLVIVLFLVLVTTAERWIPRMGWKPEPGERRTDFGFIGLSGLVDLLVNTALISLVVWLAGFFPAAMLQDVPLSVGIVGVLLVGGFGDYWAHRWAHEWSWWWKLHAVHHAPHRMVALNNMRLHPIDLGLKLAFANVPVLMLGFSPEALALAGAVKGLNIAFQHADLDLQHGFINYVFSTNSLHRWHHSANAKEANRNYGGVLSIYDLLFGSFHLPTDTAEPKKMGLFDPHHYPTHTVLRATVAPFCWRRCVLQKH